MGAPQPDVGNVAHGVLDAPDDAVHDELELRTREDDEGGEALEVDRSEEAEEGEAICEDEDKVSAAREGGSKGSIAHVRAWGKRIGSVTPAKE